MARLCLIVETGPYTYQNFDTAYGLAKSALDKGHSVDLFFYVDGVLSVNKKINSPGERNIASMVEELVQKGVKISACGACAKFRGLGKDLTVPGTSLGSLVDAAEMLEESDVVLNLGF